MTGRTRAANGGIDDGNAGLADEGELDLSDKDEREGEMIVAIDEYVNDLIAATEDARDTEVFRAFLDAQSRFHDYSLRNTLLIKMQRPGATRVAGYSQWQDEFDRHVKQGADGIYISIPIFTERCPECGNSESYHDRIGCEYDETPSDEWGRGKVGFRTGTVFDIEQTEGEPVPSLPTEAESGEAEVPLEEFLNAADMLGVAVEIVDPDEWNYSGTGVCHPDDGSVEALGDRSDAAVVGTLAHEYGHALLHTDGGEAEDENERDAREVETEAVAYVVGRHFGLDMDGSAFYLASWSDDEPDELRDRLDRIEEVSDDIIEVIEAETDD